MQKPVLILLDIFCCACCPPLGPCRANMLRPLSLLSPSSSLRTQPLPTGWFPCSSPQSSAHLWRCQFFRQPSVQVAPTSLSLARPVLKLLTYLHSVPLAPQVQRLRDIIPTSVKSSLPSSPQPDGENRITLTYSSHCKILMSDDSPTSLLFLP